MKNYNKNDVVKTDIFTQNFWNLGWDWDRSPKPIPRPKSQKKWVINPVPSPKSQKNWDLNV